MAKTIKAEGGPTARGMRRKTRAPREVVTLPKKTIKPVTNFNDFSFLFHGEKKIGKTTLAMEGGRILFLQFDPPQRAYERMEILCKSWETFLASIRALEKADAPYDRVVVDGADVCYHLCEKFVCEKLVIDHPSDEPWSKGWTLLKREFSEAVDRLLTIDCGVWFICHSTWKEIDIRSHGKVVGKLEKLVPKLPGTAEEILNGRVDGWFAYDYEGSKRVLIIQGDERTGAGHRLDQDGYPHFRSGNGDAIERISMGKSPKVAYKRLVSAFNNEYTPPKKKSLMKKGRK